MRVSDRAIESARIALHDFLCPDDPDPGDYCGCDWDQFDRIATIALISAAPYMATTAISDYVKGLKEDIADEEGVGWYEIREFIGGLVDGMLTEEDVHIMVEGLKELRRRRGYEEDSL